MGEVLGPYDAADWFVMKQLKASIAYMHKDYTKHALAIRKEQNLFKLFRDKEVA